MAAYFQLNSDKMNTDLQITYIFFSKIVLYLQTIICKQTYSLSDISDPKMVAIFSRWQPHFASGIVIFLKLDNIISFDSKLFFASVKNPVMRPTNLST